MKTCPLWAALIVVAAFPSDSLAQENESADLHALANAIRTGEIRLVDLSHTLKAGMPFFPGGSPFEWSPISTYERDGYASSRFSMGEHTGTHMDAPYHFNSEGQKVHEVKLDRAMALACVVDVRNEVSQNPDYEVALEDILKWETRNGRIPDHSVVLLRTGWSEFWNDPDRYINAGKDGMPHFPGLSREAAEFLARDRRIAGVGTDALSVDPGQNTTLIAHRILHSQGRYHLENLGNLDQLPPFGALLMVFPLPIEGGSGAPVRAVALVRKKA